MEFALLVRLVWGSQPSERIVASVAVKAAVKGRLRFPLVAGSPASVPNPINCWPPSG